MRNRTILVTGPTSGIGREVARLLCNDGHTVIGAARRVRRPRFASAQFFPVRLDLADPESVQSLTRRLPHTLVRRIDALINVAGSDVGGLQPFTESSAGDVLHTVVTNLTGLVLLTRSLVPLLADRRFADIINVTSLNAIQPAPRLAAYSAAKAGVHGFTAALRREMAGTGVRVSEILPGMTRTGFAEARWRGDKARARDYYASMEGALRAGDVARAVVFCLYQPRSVTVSELAIVPTRRPG